MADGVPVPRWRYLRWMNFVEANMADLVVEVIKDRDLVRLPEYLDSHILKNVGHSFGPTLVARGRGGHAG
jgi:hypothetical protein